MEEEICAEAGIENCLMGLTIDHSSFKNKQEYWRVYLVSYKGNKKPVSILKNILSKSEPVSN